MDGPAEKVAFMAYPPDVPTDDLLAAFASSEEWRRALAAAPRSAFVPDRVWTSRDGLLDRQTDPAAWLAAVQRDDALVTQIDDGATELTNESPWHTPNWSSSSSAPAMVAEFLHLLGPYPDDRVLEIGTGTGWTAGLLSARLGAQHVTSIEVDEQVAVQATRNLAAAGLQPTVICAEGGYGYPSGAPYDRIHVTCGVASIPYAWIEQTRPGGVIVVPWMHNVRGAGHKVRLVVTERGAVGRFHGECAYMMLRAQREPIRPIAGEGRESTVRLDPRRLAYADNGLSLAIAAMLPGVTLSRGNARSDGSFRLVARERAPEDSWARVDYWSDSRDSLVTQVGSRNLWQELESAYLRWVSWGEPEIGRFGFTVTAASHHVWLDSSDNQIEARS